LVERSPTDLLGHALRLTLALTSRGDSQFSTTAVMTSNHRGILAMKRFRHSHRKNDQRIAGCIGTGWESLEARRLLASTIWSHDFAPGEILVQYKAQTPASIEMLARAAIGGEIQEVIQTRVMQDEGMGRLERLSFAPGMDISTAIDRMRSNPAVAYAEPNYIFRPSVVSDDTYYVNGSLWGMYSDDSPATGPSNTTNQYGSQAEKVWAQNITGAANVVVGVIDEGIQIAHPDLVDNIWVNPFEVPSDGIDNDGNGYVDDIHGWDFVNKDNTVYDGTGDDHGTHVAGTIGGRGGNGAGVAGVNWNVKMISAKFLGPNGGTTADAVKAVDYLTDLKQRHGINIVASSNSWGGGGYSQALHDAIIRHAKQDILFVAAAGNASSNNDLLANYPSNYSTNVGTSTETAASYDGVVAVASITSSGNLSGFSSYGATKVDIGAPGSGVWSTLPSNTYGSYSGTSMATPHVSGAVALYASAQNGPVTAQTMKNAILTSATPTPSLAGKTLTGGRLNIFGAIFPPLDTTPPQISGVASSIGSSFAEIRWTTNELSTTELLYGTDPANLNQTFSDPSLAVNHTAAIGGLTPQTTYYFQPKSKDASGNTATSSARTFTTPTIPPILFVDDDLGANFDAFYVNALQANGYSYETWRVEAFRNASPSSDFLKAYRVVVWNTGNVIGLSTSDQTAIAGYLDAGGRIFLSGHEILYNRVALEFQQNYLKVASYTDDVQTKSHTALGVAGHPIGDGLNLPIASPAGFGTLWIDAVTPVAGAQGWLNHGVNSTSPFSAISYRGDYNAGGFGVVFTTTPLEAISTSASSPNNQNAVLKRIIEFLWPNGAPTDVGVLSTDWLTEGNATRWTAWAEGSTATVSNNTQFVKQGSSSLKLDTQGSADAGIRYPAQTRNWDLSPVDLLTFWVYGDTPSASGWQGNQPVIQLLSPDGSLTLTPAQPLMPNRAWAQLSIPLTGNSVWQRSTVGSFDISNVSAFEIHQDTWDEGFVSYYDGLRFVDADRTELADIPENAGANAIVGILSTIDPDFGDSFTYSLVSGDGSKDNAAFSITGSTLRAISSLDYETQSNYSVRIRSTDRGGLYVDKIFAIQVIDVNEAPRLTRAQASLSGNVLTPLTNSGTWSDPEDDPVTLSASLGTVTKNANGTWSWSFVPSQAYNNQTVTITGTDHKGLVGQVQFSIDAMVSVVSSKVYYKGSHFAGTSVDAALDTSKVLAKSSTVAQTLTYANLINTTRGINGIVLDVAGLAASSLTASDFVFRNSPTGAFNEAANPPSSWAAAPAPSLVNVTAGTATTAARVRLEWADNAIADRWLQIKVLANANTGLLSPQVYYVGHLYGEVNGSTSGGLFSVSIGDATAIRPAVGFSAAVDSPFDLDKNGSVSIGDITGMRPRVGLASLRVITIPPSGSAEEGEGPRRGPVIAAPGLEGTTKTGDSNRVVSSGSEIRARLTDTVFEMPLPIRHSDASTQIPNVLAVSAADDKRQDPESGIDLLSLDAYFQRRGKRIS
jgi:subtilisin family serine protease